MGINILFSHSSFYPFDAITLEIMEFFPDLGDLDK